MSGCPIVHTVWNAGGPTYLVLRTRPGAKPYTAFLTFDRIAALRVRDELDRVAQAAYALGLQEANREPEQQRAECLPACVA